MNDSLHANRRRRRWLVGGLGLCLALAATLIQFGREEDAGSVFPTMARGKQARPVQSAPPAGMGAAPGSIAQADKIFWAEQSDRNEAAPDAGSARGATGGPFGAAQPDTPNLEVCFTAAGNSHNLMTEYSCTGKGITSLEGIGKLAALEKLDLSDNSISDLAPLAALTQLKSLNLSANKVQDIGPLSALSNLTNLNLSGNRVEDLAPLAGLSSLLVMELTSNRISYLDDLVELTDLNYLEVDANEITDVSPLSHLANLKFLNVSFNDVALGVRNLETLTNTMAIQLLGNENIPCSDLNALEESLGPGILLKPKSCLPN